MCKRLLGSSSFDVTASPPPTHRRSVLVFSVPTSALSDTRPRELPNERRESDMALAS